MPYEEITIECYSGYKAGERPVAFSFQGQRWEIIEIIDRWYEGGLEAGHPEIDYFKVRTAEGTVFLLRHVPVSDTWSTQT